MANGVIKVEGLADLERRLTSLSADIGGKVARAAAMAGGRVIQKEARRLAPVLTGAGKKSVVVKREKRTQLAAEVAIGWKKPKKKGDPDAWYMRLVELGTVKMTPRPHIRPAFDSKKEAAVERVGAVLKTRLDKAGA